MPLEYLDYQLHDLIGNAGVVMVLVSYFLLSSGRLRIDSVPYPALNAIGAVLIGYSLLFDFNLSSMIIEIVWFSISIYGLARLLRRRRENAVAEGRDSP